MKLTTDQVEKITGLILARLKEKDLIIFKADEELVLRKMIEAFTADLRAEDALDREVEAMLETHSGTMSQDGINQRRMFGMIKNKLARERDLIL
ncbi:MAG: DUF507 family protein [Thermodesulfobacteriota bacterium]